MWRTGIGVDVDPQHVPTISGAEFSAKLEAVQQKHGIPWRCGSVRRLVDREYCRTHLEDFPCCDCTRPIVWGLKKEIDMPKIGDCACGAKHTRLYRKDGKSVCHGCFSGIPDIPVSAPPLPASEDVLRPIPRQAGFPTPEDDGASGGEIRFEDFEPFEPDNVRTQGCFARVEPDKINLSAEASSAMGAKPGMRVQLAHDTKGNIALRFRDDLYTAHTVKLYQKPGQSMIFSCKPLIEKLGLMKHRKGNQPLRFPVEVYPWGAVIRVDRAA